MGKKPFSKTSIPYLIAFIFSVLSSFINAQNFSVNKNTVTSDKVRFQFLTSTLVRMEYSPGGNYADAPSAIVLKRDFGNEVNITATQEKNWVLIESEKVSLKYLLNSGKFNPDNLIVKWKDGNKEREWSPGIKNTLNLGGVSYSLDGIGEGNRPPFEPGILSRSGWFLFDDSPTPLWDEKTNWITPRKEGDGQDWYLFVYGKDYAHVLKEFSELCGKIPLVPRYTLGAWITDLNYEYIPGSNYIKNNPYTDENVKAIIKRFRSEDIPLDILVLDFAWHLYGWSGGFDWSPIFPEPKKFLDWTDSMGIKVSLNDHPSYGNEGVLSDNDSHAEEVRKKIGLEKPAKPSKYYDISKKWKFKTDTSNIGLNEKWFSADLDDSKWNEIDANNSWEEQGYPNYDGIAWYRKVVRLEDWGNDSCYFYFGGIDDHFDLYVNEKFVRSFTSGWNTISSSEISRFIYGGKDNLFVIRDSDWGWEGGIARRPVIVANEPPAPLIRFNLANKNEAEVFMDVLHNPLIDLGVDFWWIDGGLGACKTDGLNCQFWTNRVYSEFTQKHTGKRGYVFSRYGGFGSHRYPGFFTGDTWSQWETLDYEVPYTAVGGNVLMPYTTHDIGGFLGKKIDFDLYSRWLEFGVFSPHLRLHSVYENPADGNLRMPWTYGDEGINLARKFFKLRYQLIPYIYTYCRIAYDDALPIVRSLYLEYPDMEEAYKHPTQYFFGKELLVSPVTSVNNEKNIYLPTGNWIDFFTGELYEGNRTIQYKCPLDQIPVFVRSGSILPMAMDMDYTDQRPLDTLIVKIYGPEPAKFNLYEDDGNSLKYMEGEYAWTPMSFEKSFNEDYLFRVSPVTGKFAGQLVTRAYNLIFYNIKKPTTVELNGKTLNLDEGKWSWDEAGKTLLVNLNAKETNKEIQLKLKM